MKTLSLQSNTFRFAFSGLVGAAAIISAPGQALAINPITVVTPAANAGIYTIKYIEGAWTDPTVQAAIMGTPWWNNNPLASQLAVGLMNSTGAQTGTPLGLPLPQSIPNNGVPNSATAWYLFGSNTATVFGNNVVQGYFTSPPSYNMANSLNILQSSTPYTWAVGTRAPLPGSIVPGPLPLVGAAAAFGFSRRLRSRINKSASA
jgi:hypothetical protein